MTLKEAGELTVSILCLRLCLMTEVSMFLRRLRPGWADNDVGTVDMLRQTGKSKSCIWRWQSFAAEGLKGYCAIRRGPRVLRY